MFFGFIVISIVVVVIMIVLNNAILLFFFMYLSFFLFFSWSPHSSPRLKSIMIKLILALKVVLTDGAKDSGSGVITRLGRREAASNS